MPPRIPGRYRMNVRLGADGDIEEWLATDEQLERPVLIRFPGPDADPERVAQFLIPIRAAAATSHPHVQRVYAAGEVDHSAFAVAEWDGAVTVADRLKAGETLPIPEYLSNASGVAAGLAAFHANGGIHGAIDASAIHFSAAHPARLASFGRIPVTTTKAGDTAALAVVLRESVTGTNNRSVPPMLQRGSRPPWTTHSRRPRPAPWTRRVSQTPSAARSFIGSTRLSIPGP
jgi:serine/threonine protein kinase